MEIKPTIVVAAHDAGGAEIIAAYVNKYIPAEDRVVYAAGPAEKVFTRTEINFSSINIFDKDSVRKILTEYESLDYILSGTGWMTDLEQNFISIGKELDIKTVAYLEHWSNYRERFGFPEEGWENQVSDEIWVGDIHAEKLAQTFFPKANIVYKENEYLHNVKTEYSKIPLHDTADNTIVFICEPLNSECCDERDIVGSFLSELGQSDEKKNVVIALHPSEDVHKYDETIATHKGLLEVRVAPPGGSVIELMTLAHIVVGMRSMALVIALNCHKKVISYLPYKGVVCMLPHTEIQRVSKLGELKNIIIPN